MGIFPQSKTKLQLAQATALIKELETSIALKSATYKPDNQFARHVYQMLKGQRAGIYNYDLVTYVQEGYVENPHVYTGINIVVDPCKTVPWYSYDVKDKKLLQRYKAFQREGRLDEAEHMQSKALERVDNTPMQNMFDNHVNETQTWADFVEAYGKYIHCTGNDFTYAPILSGLKYITKLYSLPAQVIEILPGNYMEPVKGYQIAFQSQVLSAFLPEHIIHSKFWNPTFGMTTNKGDMLYGLSPLAPLGRVVKRSNENYKASLALLMNGFPAAVVGGGTEQIEFDAEGAKAAWIANFGGGDNKGIPLFTNVPATVDVIGLNNAEMEIIGMNNADMKDIARALRVSIQLLSDDAATHDNTISAEKNTWQNARIPLLNRIRETVINNRVTKLFNEATGRNTWCDYDLKAVPALTEDRGTKSKMHIAERESGILTENEYRELMEMELSDDPNADKKVMKTNLRYTDEQLPSGQYNQPTD